MPFVPSSCAGPSWFPSHPPLHLVEPRSLALDGEGLGATGTGTVRLALPSLECRPSHFFTYCSRSGWGSRLVAAVPRNPRWEAWSLNQFPVPASDLAVTVFCTLPLATAVCTGLSSRGPLSGAVRTGWKNRVVAALLAIIHVRSFADNPYRGTNRAPALLSARVC